MRNIVLYLLKLCQMLEFPFTTKYNCLKIRIYLYLIQNTVSWMMIESICSLFLYEISRQEPV